HRIDPGIELHASQSRVDPPDPRLADDPEVIRAGDGVVRVLGTACGLEVEGSGWVGASRLVVTNAHVLAGEQDTTVTARSGATRYDAVPVHYDPGNDIAVLRVLGLQEDPLPLAVSPKGGTAGALLGYPDNGPFSITPARIGPTVSTVSQDSYGKGPLRRSLTSLRGSVHSGNSGGPVVDAGGRVLATVFAATTGGRRGGFGVPNSVVADALAASDGEVSTGPCAR
ncbi:MAG: trypsin-like peptidase domain-containing protein, partial [Solirubrobacterales bacterium]